MPGRKGRPLRMRAVAFCGCLVMISAALGYNGKHHQNLTFLAAKHFNRCVAGTDVPLLTPLQVRYMVRTNVGIAERPVFARMFNWRYYDREDHAERSMLWIVDTRFHEHFNEISRRLEEARGSVEAYQDLGRILSYLQLVSSPAHVVPVYTARFWRFSFADRFDNFPLDQEALEEALGDDCSFLEEHPSGFDEVLAQVAAATMEAVLAPIPGMPTTWAAFWNPGDKAGEFGDYGPAGNNFGRKTEFRCEERARCVLLKDDPLYQEFALGRHLDAVRGTLAAMLLMQTNVRDTLASAH